MGDRAAATQPSVQHIKCQGVRAHRNITYQQGHQVFTPFPTTPSLSQIFPQSETAADTSA